MTWYLHTDYSELYPYLWILMCLPWIVWEVEEWNGTDFSLLHFPAIWLGFWKYFAKTNHSFTSLQDLSCRSLCIYILTKALFLFTLLLKMAYVELMVGGMCNTRFIKGHKPSNNIRARIKSHVYTTKWTIYHSTYHVEDIIKRVRMLFITLMTKMSDTAEA